VFSVCLKLGMRNHPLSFFQEDAVSARSLDNYERPEPVKFLICADDDQSKKKIKKIKINFGGMKI